MNTYTDNKRPKDIALCKLITKTINLDLKRNHCKVTDKERAEFANELGTSKGTLENKLKPSMATNDMSITEFIHLLEITGDYESLNSAAIGYGEYLYRRVTGSTKEVDLDVSISFGEKEYVFPPSTKAALDMFIRSKIDKEDVDNECQVV